MAKKEQTVYNAIQAIIARRKAAHRFPECALRRELIDELRGILPFHELTKITMDLVRLGKISYRPTKDDQSYYLT